jgi:hypothetical protein
MSVFMAALAAILLILSLPTSTLAATRTWTGGGLDDTWSNPANWQGNAVPVDGDDLIFPAVGGTTTTNDLPNLLVNTLSISPPRTFVGAAIRLQNGITVSNTVAFSNSNLDLPIQLVAPQTWTIAPNVSLQTLANGTIAMVNAPLTLRIAQTGQVDFTGVISGVGGLTASGLTPGGGGALNLRGANTFQGPTSFEGLLVALRHVTALGVGDGTVANGTTIPTGVTLDLPDGTLPPEAFTLGGVLTTATNAASVLTGPVTLTGQATLVSSAPGSLRIEGVISGAGGLNLFNGTFILANTNTYAGGTKFNLGLTTELIVAAEEAIGPGAMLDLPATARLTIRRRRQTIARLEGHGVVAFESTQTPGERATLVLTASAIGGPFSGTLVGDGLLRYNGTGMFGLNTQSPGLTGAVAVEQGQVTLNGTLPVEFTVAASSELMLGQVTTGPLTSAGRLVLYVGAAASTSLTLTGGELMVTSTPVPSELGRVTVSGPVSLSGALNVLMDFTFPNATIGRVFTIVDKTSPGPIAGTFDGVPEGSTILAGRFTLRVSYQGGDGNDVTLTILKTEREYLLSEGATSGFFATEIAVANPGAIGGSIARVDFFPVGGGVVSKDLVLQPFSRTTIRVNDIPELAGAEFSTQVSSIAGPLIVERTMTWDAASAYGAHTEHAVEDLSTTWYFAEGSQGFFKTFLLLANPQAAKNVATVQYLRTDEAPITRTYPLEPRSRFTVDLGLDDQLVNRSFGMIVSFEQQGMAERAMYFGTTPFLTGGHESAGVTAPSTTWFVPEGATGPFFETFILLANPSDAPVDATLEFLPQSGPPVTTTAPIPPRGRTTVNIETVDPSLANAAVATQVTSASPIIVERAQYWPDPAPSWYEAHNSFGVTQLGTTWGLGEGRVGQARGFQTYILLANPGTSDANVTVRFLREGVKPSVLKTFLVRGRSRFNVTVGPGTDVPELENESFGALITSDQPIAAERAMYSESPGQPVWAAGTSATAVRLR